MDLGESHHAGVLIVLTVGVLRRDVYAVEDFPIGQIGLAAEWACLAGRSVRLAQQYPRGRVDIPTHGGAVGVDVDNFRVDIADLL